MNTSFERATEGKEEWLTPPELVRALGPFDLDPCAPAKAKRPWELATNSYSLEDDGDGLTLPWIGRVFCNPPYGKKTENWLRRCSQHGNVIALVFARTETATFQKWVFPHAHALLFIAKRLSFHHVSGKLAGTAGSPSVLIAYNAQTAGELRRVSTPGEFKPAAIPGAYVPLK